MSKSQKRIIRAAAIADGPILWRHSPHSPDVWHPTVLGTIRQYRGFRD